MKTPNPVQALINEFSKLPTVGPKTAARLVFHLLNRPLSDARLLADAIIALKERVRLCSQCFSITEDDPCGFCTDERRDASLLCVVAEAKDIFALERTSAYRGRYHVLGGLISPMDGIGPAQLRVKELIDRIASGRPGEVVIATNPNAEGEATALYLSRLIGPSGVKVTRLAYGLPIGGDLDYADEVTLAKALEGRQQLAS
ncbi:MAG TPA: recombination mediator RecR [Candidatus Acidoferrales bacterium]|nr:recombination mediator RecR [Candidatus Acidoferrales bacterium]